ncbi:phage tail tape measure protein, partial [Aeromonas salmonicida]
MNPLRLQILLGAVDKITAPLKAASGQSRTTAQDLLATKKRIKELETQSGQIDGYRNLGKQIGVTRAKLNDAQTAAQRMAKELADTTKPTRAMTRELEKARQRVRDLSDAETQLVIRYGEAKAAVKEAGINTKQLGQHQRRLAGEITSANAALEQQKSKLAKVGEQQRKLAAARANYRQTQELRGQIAGHGAAGIAAGTAIGLPVYSA